MKPLVLALLACSAATAAQPGGVVLIAHKQADSVGFYDKATGELLATVPVGVKPHEMVFSHDRKLAYVTNYGLDRWTETAEGGNSISILDVDARKEIGRIDLGKYHRPHGIEIGASGKLYVTTDLPPSLLVIDPQQRSILAAHDVGQPAPHMVAVTRNEKKAYVANSGADTVTAIPLHGGGTKKHVRVGGIPMGITLSKDESRTFVTTRTGNEVVEIATRTDTISRRAAVAGQPVRIHATPDSQQLVVTLIESGEVAIIDASALKEVTRFKSGTNNEGIGVDPAGRHVYIAAQGDDRVTRYDIGTWKPSLVIKTAKRPDPILIR